MVGIDFRFFGITDCVEGNNYSYCKGEGPTFQIKIL